MLTSRSKGKNGPSTTVLIDTENVAFGEISAPVLQAVTDMLMLPDVSWGAMLSHSAAVA
jgi:hypothetical protein